MKLSKTAVEFAKKHIKNFYDSDFFVKPFEFDAIWLNWTEIKKYLLEEDVGALKVRPSLTYAVPKPKIGYRIAHQLDPLNSLTYTALAFEVAEIVEKNRMPVEKRIACSYRISTDSKGNFFAKDNGYDDFLSRSSELAKSYSHVLVTDITDFYNQIYIHRLQNSLERCDPNFRDLSRGIERLLINFNNGASKGIPVGPAASIILAEASLIDIDEFIVQKSENYVRYVDDFRIFSNSRFDLELFLHNLTKYLYNNHRLTLSSSKTEILETNKFNEKYLENPEIIEKEEIHETLAKMSDYPSHKSVEDIKALPENSKIKIEATVLQNLLNKIIDKDVLDLGLARHILRKAKKLRTRAIIVQLLENFDFFSPLIRDVVLYLYEVTNTNMVKSYFHYFEKMLNESESIKLPFVQYWMQNYFAQYPIFYTYRFIKDFISNNENKRVCALVAKKNNQVAWVRSHKDTMYSYGPWDKRAVIFACTVLSRGEKKVLMRIVEESADLIEKSLAKLVKSR